MDYTIYRYYIPDKQFTPLKYQISTTNMFVI